MLPRQLLPSKDKVATISRCSVAALAEAIELAYILATERTARAPMPHRIEIIEADITTLAVDAIVNAANNSLLGGGGSTGPSIAPRDRSSWPSAARSAAADGARRKITLGYRLPARHVIHTVGPVWQGGRAGEPGCSPTPTPTRWRLPARTPRLGRLPAISTGVYGYPADQAADIAVGTVVEPCAATPNSPASSSAASEGSPPSCTRRR